MKREETVAAEPQVGSPENKKTKQKNEKKKENKQKVVEKASKTHKAAQNKTKNTNINSTQWAQQAVDMFIDIFEIYGFDRARYGQAARKRVVKKLELLAAQPGSDWMHVLKTKTANFLNSWLRQPLVPVKYTGDFPDVLLGGLAYRWVRSKMHVWSFPEKLSFCASILYCKSGLTRPGPVEMTREVINTIKTLTTAPVPLGSAPLVDLPREWGLEETEGESSYHRKIDLVANDETIERQLRRTVRELFQGHQYTLSDRISPSFPSTSANYVNGRGGAGSVGTLLADSELMLGNEFAELKLSEARGSVLTGETSTSNWRDLDETDDRAPHLTEEIVITYDDTDLRNSYARFYFKTLKLAMTEEPIAITVPLSEALKVRVITKMPPFTSFCLKPLQKFLLRTISKCPVFELTTNGGDTPAYVLQQLGAALRPDEIFVSLDYKAATNELLSRPSEIVADEISRVCNLSIQERILFKTSLIHHSIRPDKKIWKDVIEATLTADEIKQELERLGKTSVSALADYWIETQSEQKRGQLMGSITSFPILCIINATCIRWALEIGRKTPLLLKQCPMAVNGDDGIARTNQRGWEAIQRLTKFVGLQLSIGKTYTSQQFININSRFYYYDPENPDTFVGDRGVLRKQPFKLIRHVLSGVLRGLTRSGGDSAVPVFGTDQVATIGARCRKLLELAPKGTERILYKKFIYYNHDNLKKFNVPWYIPEWLGGLGLPPLRKPCDCSHSADSVEFDLFSNPAPLQDCCFDETYAPSKKDRQRAAAILLNWKRERPCPIPQAPTWTVHQYVMQRLPKQKPHRFEDDQKELYDLWRKRYDRLYAALTVEAFGRLKLFSLEEFDPEVHTEDESADYEIVSLNGKKFVQWRTGKFLADANPMDLGRNAVRKNEKLWKLSKGLFHDPIAWERLDYNPPLETILVQGK